MAAIERKIYVDYNLQNNKISNVHADLFNVGISRKSINYALQATDNYKVIEMNVSSANTVTISASVFSAGNQVVVEQYGAGQTSFVAGAGMTLRSDSGKLKISAQYGACTIVFKSATEATIYGNLTA
jgi:hypothetical protein